MKPKTYRWMIALYIVMGTVIVLTQHHTWLRIANGIFWVIGIGLLIFGYRIAKKTEATREHTRQRLEEAERAAEEFYRSLDQWPGSPFNADVIKPGDPGWEIFEAAMKEDGVVMGQYDTVTGEVISIQNAEGKDLRMKRKEQDSGDEQ